MTDTLNAEQLRAEAMLKRRVDELAAEQTATGALKDDPADRARQEMRANRQAAPMTEQERRRYNRDRIEHANDSFRGSKPSLGQSVGKEGDETLVQGHDAHAVDNVR